MKSLDTIINNIGVGKFQMIFILICGIFQACDAMEMMVLAFLGPLLTCSWHITSVRESLLTSVVFIGMLFGGPLFGKSCDYFGRKKILATTTCALAYFGCLCAGVPTFVWILILRSLVGFCLGGIMASISTLLSEFMPIKYRGNIILIVFGFWGIGSLFITTLCALVVPKYGWRLFLLLSNIPLVMTLVTLLWLPESPRFLLLKGYKKEAMDIINRIKTMNNEAPVDDIDTPVSSQYSIMDLIHPNYRRTTFICMLNWLVIGLSYYGGVLLITYIELIPHACLQNRSRINHPIIPHNQDDSCCMIISFGAFKSIFVSIIGEITMIPIPYILITLIGRKATLCTLSALVSICFVLLNFCMSDGLQMAILFILRGCLSALFNTNYVYATEVFPTSVRSLGIGLCSSSARIGAMLAPFIINVLVLQYSYLLGTMVFAIMNFIIVFLVLLLPYETKNRKLCQTAADDPNLTIINEHEYIKIK